MFKVSMKFAKKITVKFYQYLMDVLKCMGSKGISMVVFGIELVQLITVLVSLNSYIPLSLFSRTMGAAVQF